MGIRKYYRVNQSIKAKIVRLVGPGLNVEMGLDEALQKAREMGQDLVEVSDQSTPPVARIIDFKKFLFEEKKKEKKTDKARVSLKEIRFGPAIAENDLMIRIEKAKVFLREGRPVKINVFFRGREITHPEVGRPKLVRAVNELAEYGKAMSEPRWNGPTLSVTISPVKH